MGVNRIEAVSGVLPWLFTREFRYRIKRGIDDVLAGVVEVSDGVSGGDATPSDLPDSAAPPTAPAVAVFSLSIPH